MQDREILESEAHAEQEKNQKDQAGKKNKNTVRRLRSKPH